MSTTKAAITGWGHYSPARVLTNADLEKLIDTSDVWIRTRTGISERRIAATGETTATMSTLAAQRALDKAGLAAHDLDLIICASTTPDHLLPASACLVQQRLGADRAGAFDLNTACTGFIYGLVVGSQFIQTGTYQRVLVIGAETLSRFVDWHDRNTCILFGDGAAAVVLEASEQDCGILAPVLGSRGDLDYLLTIEAGGCARPASAETIANKGHVVRMRGNDVFKFAVRSMTQAALDSTARAGLTLDELRIVIPHQANYRIISATQEALELPREKVFANVDRHGNTGAASVGIALAEFVDQEPVRPGDNLLLVSFGGGLTWASAIVRWADIDAIRRDREGPIAPAVIA
jgi:3-oxoacyl-[acyl-carrier-protein] synthase-3